jgi:hypothetical protein
MSLTSYRAAPPRDQGFSLWLKKRPAQEVSKGLEFSRALFCGFSLSRLAKVSFPRQIF